MCTNDPKSLNEPLGRKAAAPQTVEDDQEIIVTLKLRAHGSTDTANGLIERLKRQLSIMTHRDVEVVDYDVTIPHKNKDRINE